METGLTGPTAPAQDNAGILQAAPGGAQTRYRFAFHGTGLAMALILLKGMVLTMLTLGIYFPWYKTERRQFIWQNLEVHGHRLRYLGTGKELFRGYLIVVGGYIVLAGLVTGAQMVSPTLLHAVQVVFVVVMLGVVPVAIYGSRRYLLSRTSWRGIRFGLDGSAKEFAKVFIGNYMLTLVTLGIYGPVFQHKIYDYLMRNTRLGTLRFRYTGDSSEFWKLSLKWMLITVVTLGIASPWAIVAIGRYQIQHTHLGDAHGVYDLSGGLVFKIMIVQMLAIPLSAGLAMPWVTVWALQEVVKEMGFEGYIDFDAIEQAASTGDATADGLGDALDVGLGL